MDLVLELLEVGGDSETHCLMLTHTQKVWSCVCPCDETKHRKYVFLDLGPSAVCEARLRDHLYT